MFRIVIGSEYQRSLFLFIKLIEKMLRAPNADVKGQYFITNVNSSNVVAIAITLTKHTTISGEMCLVEMSAGSKRKSEADFYIVKKLCCLRVWCIYRLLET